MQKLPVTSEDSRNFCSRPAEGQCAYCGGAMEEGAVLGQSSSLRWARGKPSFWKTMWQYTGEPIGEGGGFTLGRPLVRGERCTRCPRIVLRA